GSDSGDGGEEQMILAAAFEVEGEASFGEAAEEELRVFFHFVEDGREFALGNALDEELEDGFIRGGADAAAEGPRRLLPGAALLPRLGSGVGRESTRGNGTPADQHRPASAAAFPRQRADLQHGSIRQGLRLQEGRRHGPRTSLQNLVIAEFYVTKK